MRLIRDWPHCPEDARSCVLTPGNFDGVHRGHQAIIGRMLEIARAERRPAAVLTFEPHPLTVLKPGTPPLRITPLRVKAEILAAMGVDLLFVIHFTRRFSTLTASGFVEDVLAKALGARHVVTGHDFIFGHGRSGNAAFLEKASAQHGFRLTQVPAETENGVAFSSTRIRDFLRSGDLEEAARMLGRDHAIEGRVRRGDRRGHTLGFPTANIALKDALRPRTGVYVCEARIEGEDVWRHAVVNIGRRPTFQSGTDLMEAHIFDFTGDIYGKRLRVNPLRFLRDEQSFASAETLTAQIARDCAVAKEYFREKAV